jgi:DNA-binding transcriptional MerR regulator
VTEKGPEAFRTISEAAAEVGVAAHVLRFWETQFDVIRPLKRPGGRRFYRPEDIRLLRRLRRLLHDERFSIKEIQALPKREFHRLATPRRPVGEVSGLAAALRRATGAKARLDRLLVQSAT